MRKTGTSLIAAAAISGLINGTAIRQGLGASTNSVSGKSTNAPTAGKLAPLAKVPKVHDCAGDNDCKGVGGCKTDSHDCKFKNDCKGKGGCHITKTDIQNWDKLQKELKAKEKAKTTKTT